MTDEDKISTNLRTLPTSFDAVSIAFSLNNNTFNEIINAISVNIENQKKHKRWNKESKNNVTCSSANIAYGGNVNKSYNANFHRGRVRGRVRGKWKCRGFNNNRGRVRGHQSDNKCQNSCHYCGMPGNFMHFCRFRISEEASGRVKSQTITKINSTVNNNFIAIKKRIITTRYSKNNGDHRLR